MLNRLQISALDLRLSIMAGVLVVMALVFHAFTGNFLTPENLYNIAQQTAVVGIVAAAIALIIVARQIDLSVGSVLGVVGVLIAFLMYSKGWHWAPACLAGLAVSLVIALYQGSLVAYLGVPSFVVTLGGLMSFRGAAFLIADGKTQPVSDPLFLMLGGGLEGSLGPTLELGAGPGAGGADGLEHRVAPAQCARARIPSAAAVVRRRLGAVLHRRAARLRGDDERLRADRQWRRARHPDPGADLGRGGDVAWPSSPTAPASVATCTQSAAIPRRRGWWASRSSG